MTSHLLRQSDFSGGEIAPLSYGKTDSPAYQHGLRLALNFLPTLEGPILNRPGTRFVCAVKDSKYIPRLVSFSFTDGQSFVLELDDAFIRFIQNGAQVQDPGSYPAWNAAFFYNAGDEVSSSGLGWVSLQDGSHGNAPPTVAGTSNAWWAPAPYEIESPWGIGHVDRLKFAQNGDVITVVHPSHPPYEIARLGNTNWTVTEVSFSGTPYFGNAPLIGDLLPLTPSAHPQAAVSPNPYDISATYKIGDFVIYQPGASGPFYMFRSNVNNNTGSLPVHGGGNADWTEHIWFNLAGYTKGDYTWFSSTDYDGQIYISLVDNNVGQSPASGADTVYWQRASDSSRLPKTRQYAITRLFQDSLGRRAESLQSASTQAIPITVATDRPATITLNGDAAAAPANYIDLGANIYCDPTGSGIFGLVGSIPTGGTSFTDDGSGVDFTVQPPRGTNPFDFPTGPGTKDQSWPGAFTYHEQRALYARSDQKPQDFWGSAVGLYKQFDVNTPVVDSDAYNFRPASDRLEEIRSLLSLRYLLLFTAGSVFGAYGPAGAISPSSINIRRFKTTGSSYLQPLGVEQAAIYQTSRGRIYDLVWDWRSDSYVGRDISVIARHFFDGGLTVTDWCYAETPYSMIWARLSDGRLISVTYSSSGVAAWAQQATAGSPAMKFPGGFTQPTLASFERVCSVPEADPNTDALEDAIYVVVTRVANGKSVRYIERFSSRVLPLLTPRDVTQAQFISAGVPTGVAAPDVRLCNFLDCSSQFDGRNNTAVSISVNQTEWSGGDELTLIAGALDASSPLGMNGFNSLQQGDRIVLDPDNEALSFTFIQAISTTRAIVTADSGVSLTEADDDYDPHGSALAGGTKFWGWAASQITGLSHLEAMQVNALIDGAVAGPFTVTNGAITLGNAGVIVQVGIGYNSDLDLLDVAADQVKANVKSVRRAFFEVVSSRGLLAGETFAKMAAPQLQEVKDGNTVPQLFTGTAEIYTASSWNQGGRACLRQSDPLPLAVNAVTREIMVEKR